MRHDTTTAYCDKRERRITLECSQNWRADVSRPAGRVAPADQLWTYTSLRPDQYAQPVLALIALRQMEARFIEVEAELKPTFKGRLKPTPADYQDRGATFLPEMARFSRLLALPGNANFGALSRAIDARLTLAAVRAGTDPVTHRRGQGPRHGARHPYGSQAEAHPASTPGSACTTGSWGKRHGHRP